MTVQEKIIVPEAEMTAIKAGHGVVETTRKLARIVELDDVIKHPGADRLSLAIVGGWQCVIKLDEFKKGDRAIYCEIDSLLPLSNIELFGFLEARRSDNRLVDGSSYHRLKTAKFRKELAQGLIVPIPKEYAHLPTETNLTMELGILKYEPKPPQSSVAKEAQGADWYSKLIRRVMGNIGGTLLPWPTQLTKTDQERVQNKSVAFYSAKKSKDVFEVTYKFDGSSMTVFCLNDGGVRTGVCSRNYELGLGDNVWTFSDQLRYWVGSFMMRNRKFFKTWKLNIPEWKSKTEGGDNNFTRYVTEHSVIEKLEAYQKETGEYLTLQGELIGPSIQDGFEGVEENEYHVFSIFRDGNIEMLPDEAREVAKRLGVSYIPVLDPAFVIPDDFSIKDLLSMAEGQRAFNQKKQTYREGLVFKCTTRVMSWKAISNSYLLKVKDED